MPDEQVLLIVIRLEGKCMVVVSEGMVRDSNRHDY